MGDYTVEFDFSPAYELFASLYAYSFKKLHKRLELGPDWIKTVRGQIPVDLQEQLTAFGEVWHAINLLTWECPEKHTADAFLRWLDRMPLGEVYERLAPYVPSFPADLADRLKRHVEAGAAWNEHYFRHVDPAILEHLHASMAAHREQAGTEEPADLIERLTGSLRMEPAEELRTILLIPQVHCAPMSITDSFRGMTTILYPVELPTQAGEPSPALLRMTRALSDRSRLRILRFLADGGPHSLTDVVKHIGLSKSTVHEHLALLRDAGLVRAHVRGESWHSYSLHRSNLRHLPDELGLYLGESLCL